MRHGRMLSSFHIRAHRSPDRLGSSRNAIRKGVSIQQRSASLVPTFRVRSRLLVTISVLVKRQLRILRKRSYDGGVHPCLSLRDKIRFKLLEVAPEPTP